MGNQGLCLFNKDCLHFSVINVATLPREEKIGVGVGDLLGPNHQSSWAFFTWLCVSTCAAAIHLYKRSPDFPLFLGGDDTYTA